MNILKTVKKVYFIGIKGSGMAALAQIFKEYGMVVVGSDVAEKFFTDEILLKAGISFKENFLAENISSENDVDLVVYSSSYNSNNSELDWALRNGIKSLSYAEVLGEISKEKFTIAVCGTHGKTTTSAMLALAMKNAGLDPVAIVGSKIKQLGTGALSGKSSYFILEADEYQDKFQYYHPSVVILTSIDFDHPDYFKDFEAYKNVFKKFIAKIPPHGFLVAWGGSADVVEIAKSARCNIIFYDFFSSADSVYRLKEEFLKIGKKNIDFYMVPRGLSLSIPGRHNLLNASAVLALSKKIKMDEDETQKILSGFQGTARRFDLIGKTDSGAVVIDDYAHHPEEIKATLRATREKYPEKNIICVFHPHTFSRTKSLLEEFSQCFDNCDNLIVLDIYGSAREKKGEISSADLVEKVKKFKKWAVHIPTIDETFLYLNGKIGQSDLVITMGAGNVNELGEKLVKK